MEAISAFSLPPGFGFHPTDVELISHYLKKKILGHKVEFEVIPEVDIYKHEPWDLPAKSLIPSGDCKWHFFTSRDRKYPNGSRSNRATGAGYWKSTGKDRSVRSSNRIIGTKKTLVFHEGKPPYGKRTDWIMHEYYLNENECKTAPSKDIFVLCRVTKRNGLTKEEEKVVSTQVENNISLCASLPSINCPKELQDVSLYLMPKKEACSPAENVDDFEAWFTELYDPTFCTDPQTEPKSEDKVGIASLDVKHDLEGCFMPNHIEETDVSAPEEHDFYGVLGYPFNAYEFDDSLFGLSNSQDGSAVNMHQLEPVFGVGSPSYLGYAARCPKDEVLAKFSTSVELLADHERMIPKDGEESVAVSVPNLPGHQDTIVDTGIKIRERHGGYSNEIPCHRIRLQVHKMESRNPGPVNQTFIFASQDNHLDSTCEVNLDSLPLKTKGVPDLSGVSANSHWIRAQLQEKVTYENSSAAATAQHAIKSRGRISDNKPQDPSSKSDYKLGSFYASISSTLRRRKLVDPCNPSKFSLKSHDRVKRACGFLRGICPFLRKCSVAWLNCLFLVTCMIGTAILITFFLVRDARRFLGTSHAFDL